MVLGIGVESCAPGIVRWSIALTFFAFLALAIGCGGEDAGDSRGFRIEGTEPGDCEDGVDNDADGLFDCDDTSCAASPPCADGGAGGAGGSGGASGIGGAGGSMLCAGVDCDDSNECTEDACNPLDGTCDYTNLTDGTSCDFGGLPGVCMSGVCEDAMLCASVDCDDSNQCTQDVCEPLNGECGHTNVIDDTACDFGSLPGLCVGGVCEDAMLCASVDCEDGNECTEDTCDPMNGSCGYANVTDGTSCDFGGLPGVCAAGLCGDAMLCASVDCDDGNECTEDTCDPMDGMCGHTNMTDGASCDFGGALGVCSAGVCEAAMDCGDGERQPIEACDDGNDQGGDGCSADCLVLEEGFRCPSPGAACVPIVCGDSRIDPPEQCDDGNYTAADGCSASCELEPGWVCLQPGVACSAAECGDGLVAGFEQCDDGDSGADDGCSSTCQIEEGYKCETPDEDCVPTICGDGMKEGTEQCDDGNVTPFDGCSVHCKNEPNCTGGACQSVCGDGVILPGTGEACDDGNTVDGDGCSSACQIEDGFECELSPVPLPDELAIPVIYRDFRSYDASDSEAVSPDFNNPNDSNSWIAFDITEDFLDAEGKPVLSGENPYVSGSNEGPPHSASSFAAWYRTSPTLDPSGNLEVIGELLLGSTGGNVYQFSSSAFYPLDDPTLAPLAWSAEPTYGEVAHVPNVGGAARNFGFTTEMHYFFVYQGDEVLSFSGDDDFWVFVDGFLCLDVGGLHPSKTDVMSFANPTAGNSAKQDGIVSACTARLTPGDVYEVAIFHAERHTSASNFSLTLDGFVTERSACDYGCGDGIATRFEFCDDGPGQNTGEYGHCNGSCTALGPHCGDGIIQEAFEDCDNGENLGGYNGCNPDCSSGPFCGDGVRQPDLGESCDAGEQNGEPGSTCSGSCQLVVQ